jgi:hypothetical protein
MLVFSFLIDFLSYRLLPFYRQFILLTYNLLIFSNRMLFVRGGFAYERFDSSTRIAFPYKNLETIIVSIFVGLANSVQSE